MKLKLNESIICGGQQYLPPSIVDTDVIGITQADADVLVRRGTAVPVAEQAPTAAEATSNEAAEAEAEAKPTKKR